MSVVGVGAQLPSKSVLNGALAQVFRQECVADCMVAILYGLWELVREGLYNGKSAHKNGLESG